MNYEALLAGRLTRPVRAALIGAGEFGYSLIARARVLRTLEVPVVCDRDVVRACEALARAGVPQEQFVIANSRRQALATIERGAVAVVADGLMATELPVDIVVEATGDPESGARIGAAAIDAGKHVAMVSKETDSTVGPILAARARAAGVIWTPVDGDQPSLLMGLVSWARTLGLAIVAAGKSSEYDFVFDRATGEVTSERRRTVAPGLAALWDIPPGRAAEIVARRAEAVAAIPQRTVPDYCEMTVVSNATGLVSDTPGFHAPVARTIEVPELFRPQSEGGLLAQNGIIDVFNCLRRPDEASFAGGVFVVVCFDDKTVENLLRGKGIPTSRDGTHALLYNPSHLLGVEAPLSLLLAVGLGHASCGENPRPVSDLVAITARPFKAGEHLVLGERHAIEGFTPRMQAADLAKFARALPYYMAAGRRIARDLPAGAPVTYDAIEAPEDSMLWRLRAEQDARPEFAAKGAPVARGKMTCGWADSRPVR